MSQLPDYLAAAKPVPLANRAPWYKTITPTYAGIMLWFVMFMLGGVGPPPEVLPSAMGAVGEATPLLHAVRLLQGSWLGTGWNWTQAGILAGILVASLGLSALVMRVRSAR